MAEHSPWPNSTFDRLLKDRIIWLGEDVRDDNANEICAKMQGAKEKINGRIIPYSAVINAVVLYIA